MKTLRDTFLDRLHGFFDKNPDVSPSALGKKAVNCGRVVHTVLKGGTCTLDTADKILDQTKKLSTKRGKRK